MVKTKRQHFVPQHYLRGFSKLNGKKHFLYTYNKKSGEKFPANIKNIGHENYFYDTSEDQEIEKRLSKLEAEFNIVLKNIIKIKDLKKLSNQDKEILSKFIALQFLRTNESRIMLEQTSKTLIDEIIKKIPGLDNLDVKIDKNESRDNHVALMFDLADEIYKIILDEMAWKLCINNTETPFWTSDHPCASYNELNPEQYTSNMGLRCNGFQLHIPLSNELLLIVMNPDIKLSDLTNSRNVNNEKMKDLIEKICEKNDLDLVKLLPEIEYVDQKRVEFENNLQVVSSTQFIFSGENDFQLADEFLDKNPKYKDKNRKR